MRMLAALLLTCLPLCARAGEPVDIALVLVTDVSRSINETEYQLEKTGYSDALKSERVIDAIKGGPVGAVAIAYVEFAGAYEVRTVVDWTIVRDATTATALADQISKAPRSYWGRTSISSGIDHAMEMLKKSDFQAQRQVIDVAGDGTNNSGRDITEARDDALKAGVTINGLAIINESNVAYNYGHVQPPGGLTNWYRQNVIGGPGSFALEVRSFDTFGESMARKLLSEIADNPSDLHGGPTDLAP